MTSRKKFPRKFASHASNLCFRPKSSRKETNGTFVKLFLNAMIRNIKYRFFLCY